VTYRATGLAVVIAGRPVLRGVSLAVEPGSVTAVVGGDGAGKTTLLRCFVGEVQPTDGTVDRTPKNRMGSMPATSGTWADLTVDENVDFVGRCYGVPPAALAARRAEVLGAAGLLDARDRLARDLSGGMRQKLGFCLAALHRPPLLVLDEPSTGVDPVSRVELWRMIAAAAADGAAVLMATTYLDEAERASRVLVLDGGRPLLAGTPAELLATEDMAIVETREATPGGWRRGRMFRVRRADGPRADERLVTPDLEDVVIAAMIDARAGEVPSS
jgi:ABC-2 type transport system ATP-binding protein